MCNVSCQFFFFLILNIYYTFLIILKLLINLLILFLNFKITFYVIPRYLNVFLACNSKKCRELRTNGSEESEKNEKET